MAGRVFVSALLFAVISVIGLLAGPDSHADQSAGSFRPSASTSGAL